MASQSINKRNSHQFLWGAATSAYQVEGDNQNSDWWKWEEIGRVRESSGLACDQYMRYESDFDLATELGHNAHRFSIEWSRIEPAPGQWNDAALTHYCDVLNALSERGLEPIVTLYHFTLPAWLAERGGWLWSGIEQAFTEYVRRVVERLGDRVRHWVTINEPLVYVYRSYIEGIWPPGQKNRRNASRVIRVLARAHCLAYLRIHDSYRHYRWQKPRVSIAKNVITFTPCNPQNPGDRLAAWLRHRLFNHLFVQALHSGWLIWPGMFFERLPAKRTLNFLGLNYYTRHFVRQAGWNKDWFGEECPPDHHNGQTWRNTLGWEVRPIGLYEHLLDFARYRIPILITENGICTNDDRERERFIEEHLQNLVRAVREGVQVEGYFHWSLIDNYEWADGFDPRFGLVEVDFRNQKRTPKKSAYRFAQWCQSGSP